MKSLIAQIFVVATLVFGASFFANAKSFPEPEIKKRAISLKQLVNRIEPYHNAANYPELFQTLGGLTQLNGYIFDDENKDVILFGEVNPNHPPIMLEDFVVALRNLNDIYCETQADNSILYEYPGCSIDPRPETMKKLNYIFPDVAGEVSDEELEETAQLWLETCSEPQDVVVFGVPFESNFARVMVIADYDLKSIVDGMDSIPIPDFMSIIDRIISVEEQKYLEGNLDSIPLELMFRFWFYPGETSFSFDDKIVSIKNCSVTLLTEQMFLNETGETKSLGRTNPYGLEFAEKFTKRYDEIAEVRPIFKELEDLYRFFALAQSISSDINPHYAHVILENLWRNYRIRLFEMWKEVPGRANIKGFRYHKTYSGGYEEFTFYIPSCGGVSMEIETPKEAYVQDSKGELLEVKKQILKFQPESEDIWYWEYTSIM